MATVRDLIRGSMRLIGAVATGETPSADEQADALVVLNDMLDSWSTEGLTIFAAVRESFSLTAGQSSYTLGPSGNFNTTRPTRIERAAVELSTGAELPIRILSLDEWAEVTLKSTQSTIPQSAYIETSNPLETVNLWPVPNASGNLVLYSHKALSSFANVNDTVTFPPGYAKVLRYGLALELAPEYGKAADPAIAIQFTEAKENIKRANIKPSYMDSDVAGMTGRRGFNIYTGE